MEVGSKVGYTLAKAPEAVVPPTDEDVPGEDPDSDSDFDDPGEGDEEGGEESGEDTAGTEG